jgi:hypothetical protein
MLSSCQVGPRRGEKHVQEVVPHWPGVVSIEARASTCVDGGHNGGRVAVPIPNPDYRTSSSPRERLQAHIH